MALTKISDIIEPGIWLKYQQEFVPEKLDFINSSAFAPPPAEIAAQMSAGGTIIDVPYWKDTDRAEPNIMSDDETVSAVPKKITASKMQARKLFWHQSWSQADLAGVFATGSSKDPLKSLVSMTERYWRRIAQLTLVKCLDGIRARNVGSESSDMLYTVYSDQTTPAASTKISPAAVNAARATSGEFMDEMGLIVMHSKVYTDALNQENISFVQPSELPFKVAMFAGMQVVVSDDCTTVSGTNSPLYRSYLFGTGAVTYTVHMPDTPVEVDREPEKGNGGGLETLHNRRHALVHPLGYRFTSSSVAGKGPSWAELATAANWERKHDRKLVKMAILETN
jgi:hypothetical protein